MTRRLADPSLPVLMALALAAGALSAGGALAQDAPLTAPALPQADNPTTMAVPKTTTPPQPGAAQPTLPSASQGSPVVEKLVEPRAPLTVRKEARRSVPRRHYARHGHYRHGDYAGRVLDRPALAGVELVAPLPPPGEPPHVTVPTPAYPLESFATAFTTPPPPIVCHPARREPGAPDPHLYREVPVVCEPDNP